MNRSDIYWVLGVMAPIVAVLFVIFLGAERRKNEARVECTNLGGVLVEQRSGAMTCIAASAVIVPGPAKAP